MLFVSAEPPEQALDDLTTIVDSLADALIAELPSAPTLGHRVEAAAPTYDARYRGEMEHPSGIVAQVATFEITVGEGV
jgi:hypothetical protein